VTNSPGTTPETLLETAAALQSEGRCQEAVDYYRFALRSGGEPCSIYLKMAGAILAQRNPALYPISLACYQKSVRLNPANPLAHLQLGSVLIKLGRQQEAAAAFQTALQLDPGLIQARFHRLKATCPILYQKPEDIPAARAAYARQLAELGDTIDLTDPESIEKASRAVGIYPFHLGYQGCNDIELQRRYGTLVCRIQAARYPQGSRPLPTPPRKPGEPLRVGIVSGFFHHHATWKVLTRGWLEALDKNRIHLYGYYTGARPDDCTAFSRLTMFRFVENDFSLESLCHKILTDRLQVLIYPEIGMNRLAARLSALRLAPVQCVSWGHSTTSGLPTMDFFISNDLMEPGDGANHYSETLIRLPRLGIYYSPPAIGPATVSRAALGLKEEAVLYLCIQSLFKYLPQYDEVFPRIARKTGNCQFVFTTRMISGPVADILRRRLAAAFARFGLDSANHVVFLPYLDKASYLSLHRLGDVFLDSIGWSGCNTTLEAVDCNLPVVTLPSPLMRGRQSMAILNRMGLTSTIADTVDHYVEIAARLGADPQWREQTRRTVAARKHRLYRDSACIQSLEAFLEKTASEDS